MQQYSRASTAYQKALELDSNASVSLLLFRFLFSFFPYLVHTLFMRVGIYVSNLILTVFNLFTISNNIV